MLCWHLIGKSKLIKSVSKAVFSRLLIILYRTTIIRGRTFDFWKGGYGWFQKKKMSCRLSSREKNLARKYLRYNGFVRQGKEFYHQRFGRKKFLRERYWPIKIEANLGTTWTTQIYSSVGLSHCLLLSVWKPFTLQEKINCIKTVRD